MVAWEIDPTRRSYLIGVQTQKKMDSIIRKAPKIRREQILEEE